MISVDVLVSLYGFTKNNNSTTTVRVEKVHPLSVCFIVVVVKLKKIMFVGKSCTCKTDMSGIHSEIFTLSRGNSLLGLNSSCTLTLKQHE